MTKLLNIYNDLVTYLYPVNSKNIGDNTICKFQALTNAQPSWPPEA